MKPLTLQAFVDFLLSGNWRITDEGKRFITYKPPQHLGLPQAYFLELPKDDFKPGWKRYADGIVEILADIYHQSQEDIRLRLTGKGKGERGKGKGERD